MTFSRIFNGLGASRDQGYYVRDFRNAGRLSPGVNPPRMKFQGYVNFIFNREIFAELFPGQSVADTTTEASSELRTTLSSLVRTAELPSVNFKTETKNKYNAKKIIHTGVEYPEVNLTVFDTVSNDWLITLMKYFSYHFMNPRNKQDDYDDREIYPNSRAGGTDTAGSQFGKGSTAFDSNAYGYNPNYISNFFERIDYVLYHGNRGVQYSLYNPTITAFKPGTIDYSASEVMEFQVTLAYESFTINNLTNFGLTEEDLDRFENVRDEEGEAYESAEDLVDLTTPTIIMSQLGSKTNPVERSYQPKPTETMQFTDATAQPTYGAPVTSFETSVGSGGNILTDVLGDVIDRTVVKAVNGGNIKDAAINSALGGIVNIISNSVRDNGNGST